MEVHDLASGTRFSGVSIELRKGEILGFAGLVGAGRTEVLETLFGLRPRTSGTIKIHGKEAHISRPADALKYGMAMLTEDRRGTGIIPVSSVANNIVVANLKRYVKKSGFINHRKITSDARDFIRKIEIKTPSQDTLVQDLSGGNQQKVLVARWLLTEPEILFVDEPTRGIDVGAKAEIHALITKMAGEGKAITWCPPKCRKSSACATASSSCTKAARRASSTAATRRRSALWNTPPATWSTALTNSMPFDFLGGLHVWKPKRA